MTTKLLLINGPIGCGKTEAVKYIAKHFNIVERRCKDKLFKLTQEFFCVSEERFFDIYNDRALKETPLDEFQVSAAAYNILADELGLKHVVFDAPVNLSIRQAMIFVSECVCKPVFSDDYFGKARALSLNEGELAIDDSAGGWVEELIPSLARLGRENVMLIRVYGRGTFEGDSRKYLPSDAVDLTVDVYNTGTEQEFLDNMLGAVAPFFRGEV